MVMVIER
jgi:hypothetical protein